jgi:hypothetical protein
MFSPHFTVLSNLGTASYDPPLDGWFFTFGKLKKIYPLLHLPHLLTNDDRLPHLAR